MKPKIKPHPLSIDRDASNIYTAQYTDHPVPEYNHNPLIRALTPLPNYLTLQASLTKLPEYEVGERQLPREVKVLRLQKLFRFYVGLPRVANLMETLHAMICEGYMGRMPHSAEDNALRQQLYERQQSGEFFDIEEPENGAEFTAALVGIPGGGKSQALKRASKPYRRVIYHPDLNIYQIPALLIEMPYKGVSANTLAHAIIRAIDKVYPMGDYYRTYLSGKANAEVLFMDAVMLLQTHKVGILLVDESQNREYRNVPSGKASSSIKKQTPLTTLLITATNESQIPMLMCATPELYEVLGARMSMLRRSAGRGLDVWKPLSLPTVVQGVEYMGEFDVVLKLLWDFQWTRSSFPLTQRIRSIFYYYSQGIPDIIIKLFHDVQLRAIRNGGDEVVDEALVHDVAQNELRALTNLTRALRGQDYSVTEQAADLAAYLRFDPHELDADRRRAQEGLLPGVPSEFPDAGDLPPTEAELEAVATPVEVPTGPSATRKPRKRTTKRATTADTPPPDVKPVNDLGEVFGD